MASSSSNAGRNPVEKDPSERYVRYDKIIREDDTKKVYLGCDLDSGREIGWSKTELTEQIIENEELLESLRAEAQQLKLLSHKNVVEYLESWIDNNNDKEEKKFINLINEFLPSGNLGEYITSNSHVRVSAIKYWCCQILKGLEYLHSQNIIHGALEIWSIFVNGNSAKMKIGDLGFTVFEEQGRRSSSKPDDIHSFGVCVAAMVALSEMGLEPEIKLFIDKCLSSVSNRPTASELLKDSFLELMSDSSTKEEDESLGDHPIPRRFVLRGRYVGSGQFKMKLTFENGGVEFDYSVENDTTEEVIKRIEAEEESLSNEELTLISQLIEQLTTAMKSSECPQVKALQITSEDRIVRPAFRVTTTRLLPEAGSSSSNSRSFIKIKGRKVGRNNPFKMSLYFSNSGRIDLDFSVENDTPQEAINRIETEGLVNMSSGEFALVSELMEQLITALNSSDSSQLQVLEITSKDRVVRPTYQVMDILPEVIDMRVD